ncbi:NADH:flavin oxidoreductase [Vallitalea okinawensis]|uniref:NADH:flavin oxidoreductase n=1 Tax=Vallitalea okinawensis TaxID=2078660 RepID=UPI000CFC4B2A|nr:NADH:flavin oxidoreductase [Vallitalea okinawensis]
MRKDIFSPVKIAGLTFKNHILRSGTHEGMADEYGRPTESLKKTYRRLAAGGVGGIITGYSGIMQRGKSENYNMLMMDKDELIDDYKVIVEEVHQYGVPIIHQLAHCGNQTSSKVTGMTPIAPSPIKNKVHNDDTPLEATEQEIEDIINHFVSATRRSEQAGFDGVQLHLAHGYLLSSFLSKNTNRRKDKWGGSLENRYRIVDLIITRIKKIMPSYPVFVKLNAYDHRKNGMREEEAVQIAKMLEKSGCDAIEVSCGVEEDGLNMTRGNSPTEALLEYGTKYKNKSTLQKKVLKPIINKVLTPIEPIRNYNVDAAKSIKNAINIPVIVVGGIRTKSEIENIIENDKADMVAMSRPFVLEPNIVSKFKEGKQDEPKCINCNYCIIAIQSQPLRCYYGKIL